MPAKSVATNAEGRRSVGDSPRSPLPTAAQAFGTEVVVPRFSEYRPAVGAPGASSAASPTRPSKPAKGRWLVGLVLLGVSCTAAYSGWNSFVRYTAYGLVEGRVVEVVPPWNGEVQHVQVREGDRVEPGQVLMTLDNPDLRRRLARVEEELRIARATLSAETARLDWQGQIDSDRRQQALAEFYEAWGNLLNERSQLDLAVRRLARAQELGVKKAIAGEEVESAHFLEAGQRQKVAKLESAVAELRRRAEVDPQEAENTKRQLEPHLLRIETLQAEISRCQEQLAQGRIQAPVSGTVIKREALPGDHVEADRPILLLLEEGSAEIVLYLSQEAAHGLQLGHKLEVEIRPQSKLITCEVVRVGQRLNAAPRPIERHYDSNQNLLPVYLRPTNLLADRIDLRLGSIAALPRSWRPSLATVNATKE